ncbi:MAG TPA: DinB family protein [Anaerolineales bacterium]|nr:DinB family protein [Anaerolineales bacterium]
MIHPLVRQLHFTRSEFIRGLEGVTDEEARRRFAPMNCLSWNLGHLTWQEQRYCVTFAQGLTPRPDLNEQFAYGAPASTPVLADMRAAWEEVTEAAGAWLEALTTADLLRNYTTPNGSWSTSFGNLLQRLIYHYWYHTGENLAIRQLLGHTGLPEFVGNIDGEASYSPDG